MNAAHTIVSPKCVRNEDALQGLQDGATLLVGGFGDSGVPFHLLSLVQDSGVRDLTVVSINAGRERSGIAGLIAANQVAKVICTFPRTAGSVAFEAAYRAGRIQLELVPMGTLVERLRAGGAGLPAFFSPVSAGTQLAQGKEARVIDGRHCVLEYALRGDFALVRAQRADTLGNLVYRGTARNLNPVAATAARVTIAEVEEIVAAGEIAPEAVVTPSAYVDRIVVTPRPARPSPIEAQSVALSLDERR